MFDTHTYVKKLELAGFTETQAEVQVEALSAVLEEIKETLATKDDLLIMEERLTGQNRSLEERLTGQNRSLEERLTGQMNTRFAQVDAQIHSLEERLTGQLRSAIAESQNTTLKWIVGLFVTLLGVFIALLKIH
ncbi:MAG: CCDC90 family protein [Leptospirales bacterium]